MQAEILYEKKYPHFDAVEEMIQMEMESADEPQEPVSIFEDVYQKLMADEFDFFTNINGFDLTISMNYYTHAVIRRGRIIAP